MESRGRPEGGKRKERASVPEAELPELVPGELAPGEITALDAQQGKSAS